jgi:hypothetical protein
MDGECEGDWEEEEDWDGEGEEEAAADGVGSGDGAWPSRRPRASSRAVDSSFCNTGMNNLRWKYISGVGPRVNKRI